MKVADVSFADIKEERGISNILVNGRENME